jgi:hypothetical protein
MVINTHQAPNSKWEIPSEASSQYDFALRRMRRGQDFHLYPFFDFEHEL